MRLVVSSSTLAILALSGVASTWAFMAPRPLARTSASALRSSQGWDNEDFLEALGGGSEAIEKANDDYNVRVQKREAQESRLRQQHEDEINQTSNQDDFGAGSRSSNTDADKDQGGSRFKEMLKASQTANSGGAFPRPIDNPFLNPPPSPPTPPQPGNLDELTVEEQAKMFRVMMQNQGSLPGPGPDVPSPMRTKREDRAGRPIGRNRDADSIANSSDLYFAQLKRDSSIRTLARIRGEEEKAESVFEDEGIAQLSDLLQSNPYLKDHKARERNLIDTIPEEAIAPYMEPREARAEDTSPGISYKEKLARKKGAKGGGQASVANRAPELDAGTVQQYSQPTGAVGQPQVKESPKQMPSEWTETDIQPAPAITIPTQAEARAATVESAPSAPALPVIQVELEDTSIDSTNPEDVRQKIRTLMGMTLKHRGGPGFGSGRLKGKEVEGFESLLSEATRMLRSEAAQHSSSSGPSTASQMSIPPPQQPSAAQGSQSAPSYSATHVTQTSGLENQANEIEKMVACIEGATMMYKNSPPELRESVLGTLRAALLSAVETSNRILRSDGAVPPGASAAVMPPPASQQVQQQQQQQPAFGSASAVPPQSTQVRQTQGRSAADPNSVELENILNQMTNASGGGKLGLRPDLSPSEAAELREKLMDMRSILMDELDAGIPDPEPVSASTRPTSTSSPEPASDSTSKYQQMLAKARAAKA